MAKLIKFILPLLVLLLSGYNSFSEEGNLCHPSVSKLIASSHQDELLKVEPFQKKALGHEYYVTDSEEEKEEEVTSFQEDTQSDYSISALFSAPSFSFPAGSIYNGTPVCESLSSNKRYILFAVFRI